MLNEMSPICSSRCHRGPSIMRWDGWLLIDMGNVGPVRGGDLGWSVGQP